VFVLDDDIDVFNPTDILWAFATRVQPHKQVSILQPLFRGNFLDPSLLDEDQDLRYDRRRDEATGSAVLASVQVP
jgi:UbiD family decarboxylase